MIELRLKPSEATALGFEVKERNDLGNRKYSLTEEQLETIKEIRLIKSKKPKKRKFVETILKKDKKGNIISSTEKLQSKPITVPENFEVIKISTSKTTGQQWVQYAPKKEDITIESSEINFDSIVSKYIKPVEVKVEKKNNNSDFDSLTYSDVHIGMDTNSRGNSMYSTLWNYEEVIKASNEIISKTLCNQESKLLIIDELGDLLDGYNGKTTRGGHDLPQNMTNEEVFDCGLKFKMNILDNLINHYEEIRFNNICNDNHAGSFGYFVNSAFKSLAEQKYETVTVNNCRDFISHYFVNDICFVITHGKDDSTLKFGFKPQLDPKQIEKIDQYLKHNNIYGKAKKIIFKKGDSHQTLFDMAGSDDFYYYNYPALSPSSQWVQNNFKKGRRGFVLESFYGVENTIKPFFL
jgi:hypothetical protein